MCMAEICSLWSAWPKDAYDVVMHVLGTCGLVYGGVLTRGVAPPITWQPLNTPLLMLHPP